MALLVSVRLSELFEEYELLDSDKYVPFGVKNE